MALHISIWTSIHHLPTGTKLKPQSFHQRLHSEAKRRMVHCTVVGLRLGLERHGESSKFAGTSSCCSLSIQPLQIAEFEDSEWTWRSFIFFQCGTAEPDLCHGTWLRCSQRTLHMTSCAKWRGSVAPIEELSFLRQRQLGKGRHFFQKPGESQAFHIGHDFL